MAALEILDRDAEHSGSSPLCELTDEMCQARLVECRGTLDATPRGTRAERDERPRDQDVPTTCGLRPSRSAT